MGKRRAIAMVVALASLAARPAVAQSESAPLQMAPSSPWALDYAEDSCLLRREFKAGETTAVFELQKFSPGDTMQFTIGSSQRMEKETIRLRFEPDAEFFKVQQPFTFQADTLGVVRFDSSFRENDADYRRVPRPDWPAAESEARERKIVGLTVTGVFKHGVTLQTGSMQAPMAAMHSCMDDLITRWGVDPVIQRTLSREAKPIGQHNWPQEIQDELPGTDRRFGAAIIRFVVGRDGEPTKCIPHSYDADASFGKDVCDASMRHARFEPALDASGNPTVGIFWMKIFYRED